MRKVFRPLLIWLVLLAAVFATADTLSGSLDLSTLISLIWGVVSVVIFKVIPLKGAPIVLVTYLGPLAVCAAAVFIVDGTSGFTWQKYIFDILTAYGANQALFNAAKVTVPGAVQ